MNFQMQGNSGNEREIYRLLWQVLWPVLAFLTVQAMFGTLFFRLFHWTGGGVSVMLAPVLVWQYCTRCAKHCQKLWSGVLAVLLVLGAGILCALASPFLVQTIGSCVAGPINEEIIYRGHVYSKGKSIFGIKMAVIISTLLFAGAHASVPAILPALLAGCLFALLFEKTNTLVWPVIIHVLWNLLCEFL